MGFRDRFFTRRTAEAITAPSSILAAGVGAAVGIVVGAPVAVAAAAGAAAYAGVVALRMPRSPRRHEALDIQPRRLDEPWRSAVREALDAQRRFDDAVGAAGDGPVRARLETIGQRVADGVAESWRIASHGDALQQALGRLERPEHLTQRLAQLGRMPPSPTKQELTQSLRAQIDTYRRLQTTASEAAARLQVMDARLDEAVARAIELGLRTSDQALAADSLGGLGADVDGLVTEMEALRRGLDETAGRTGTATG